jgi:hypothetical protein
MSIHAAVCIGMNVDIAGVRGPRHE